MWRDYAFLARYAHQSIPALLGRALTEIELRLLSRCTLEILESENERPASASTETD